MRGSSGFRPQLAFVHDETVTPGDMPRMTALSRSAGLRADGGSKLPKPIRNRVRVVR